MRISDWSSDVCSSDLLLADAGLRAHLLEIALGLRASFARLPLALACPSPRRWAIEAHRAALADDAASIDDFGVDESEDAAAYLADFLRVFGDVGVAVLLMPESSSEERRVGKGWVH